MFEKMHEIPKTIQNIIASFYTTANLAFAFLQPQFYSLSSSSQKKKSRC